MCYAVETLIGTEAILRRFWATYSIWWLFPP